MREWFKLLVCIIDVNDICCIKYTNNI